MIIHKGLASGRWFKLSFFEQMANVASDVERTIKWGNKGNADFKQKAFDRVLELLDFTIADPKNKKRLREIVRVREALVDYFLFDNEYGSTDILWQDYFYCFSYAAALARGM